MRHAGTRDPANETAMDQHNNVVGRQMGRRLKAAGAPSSACVFEALDQDRAGNLVVINENHIPVSDMQP